MAETYLTVREVAVQLRCSVMTVHRWIASGDLVAHQPGGPGKLVRVAAVDLDAFKQASVTRADRAAGPVGVRAA